MKTITHKDRSEILQFLMSGVQAFDEQEKSIITKLNEWLRQKHYRKGYGAVLSANLLKLVAVIRSSEDDSIKSIAIQAIGYVLGQDEQSLSSNLGLVSFVSTCAVQEIHKRLGPNGYACLIPTLTADQKMAAEELFLQLMEGDNSSEESSELISKAQSLVGGLSSNPLAIRTGLNISELCRLTQEKTLAISDLRVRNAALRYFLRPDDVISDDEDPFGYLDDLFVTEQALHLIGSSPYPWLSIIDELLSDWTFLNDLVLSDSNEKCGPSDFLLVNSALVRECLASNSRKRIAIVTPSIGPTTILLGFIAAIGNILEAIRSGENQYEFEVGKKVLVDGKAVYEYQGIVTLEGMKKLKLTQRGKTVYWPDSDIKRLSPVRSDRKLRGKAHTREQLEREAVSPTRETLNLDQPIRNLDCIRTLFLVTKLAKGKDIAKNFEVLNEALDRLIPTGIVHSDGDVELITTRWGQQQPWLAFISDLDRIREVLEEREPSSSSLLIELDGDNASRTSALSGIKRCDVPVVVVVRKSDRENIGYLKEEGFDIWEWKESDFKTLVWPNRRSRSHLGNFEKQVESSGDGSRLKKTLLKCNSIERSFECMKHVESIVERTDTPCTSACEELFEVGLSIFRRLSRLAVPIDTLVRSQIQLQCEMVRGQSNTVLSKPERDALDAFGQSLNNAACELHSNNPKANALSDLISKQSKVSIVCQNAGERQDYQSWTTTRSSALLYVDNCELNVEGIVAVPAWYGKKRMTLLMYPPIGESMEVLLYEFEDRWRLQCERKIKKLHSDQSKGLSRSSFFNVKREWPTRVSLESAADLESIKSEEKVPVMELDERVQDLQLRRICNAVKPEKDEPVVAALPVFFAGGSYAVLTDAYLAVVVTHLIEMAAAESKDANVLEKHPKDLKSDDVLLFVKGSSKDAIRELADQRLPAGERETARLWQKALLRYQDKNSYSLQQVWQQLRAGGCTHHKLTVKNWITSEVITAPRDAHDHELQIIATVTQDAELLEKFSDCDRAISKVWGAHLAASSTLADQVRNQAANILERGNLSGEIVNLGSNVVLAKIESISSQLVQVRRSVCNKLLDRE